MSKSFSSKGLISEILYSNYKFLGIWILLERHTLICDCSYCQEPLKRFQIRLPHFKYLLNGWKVIAWKYNNNKYYLRIN